MNIVGSYHTSYVPSILKTAPPAETTNLDDQLVRRAHYKLLLTSFGVNTGTSPTDHTWKDWSRAVKHLGPKP